MRVFNLFSKIDNLPQIVGSLNVEIQLTLNTFAKTIAEAAYNMGVNFVDNILRSTRLDYQNHFHYKQIDESNHLINLDAEANHLEDGYERFDMKPGLLGGPKARISKKGLVYNIIPFRHGTKESAKNLKQQYMGMEASQALKNGISRLSRQKVNLNKIQIKPDGTPLQGNVGKIKDNPLVHPNLRGLTRYQKTYDKATQAQSMTFRVVTSKSKPASWWHPGYRGVHAFREMEKFIDSEMNRIIKDYKF